MSTAVSEVFYHTDARSHGGLAISRASLTIKLLSKESLSPVI